MSLSTNGKQAVMAEETAAVFTDLLTIEVDGYSPLHFCDNMEAVTSNDITYTPVAFTIILPAKNDDGTMRACQLQVDNVDRAIAESVEKAKGKNIIVTESVVIAQTPDVVERGPIKMILRNVSIDKKNVGGELYDLYIYDRKLPEGTYNPQDFPGLFVS